MVPLVLLGCSCLHEHFGHASLFGSGLGKTLLAWLCGGTLFDCFEGALHELRHACFCAFLLPPPLLLLFLLLLLLFLLGVAEGDQLYPKLATSPCLGVMYS